MLKLLLASKNDPNRVPPSLTLMIPSPLSRLISPATSIVRSPELRSISVPSIVMLSTTTPALAVSTPVDASVPETVAFPETVVAPLSSTKVSVKVPPAMVRIVSFASSLPLVTSVATTLKSTNCCSTNLAFK